MQRAWVRDANYCRTTTPRVLQVDAKIRFRDKGKGDPSPGRDRRADELWLCWDQTIGYACTMHGHSSNAVVIEPIVSAWGKICNGRETDAPRISRLTLKISHDRARPPRLATSSIKLPITTSSGLSCWKEVPSIRNTSQFNLAQC